VEARVEYFRQPLSVKPDDIITMTNAGDEAPDAFLRRLIPFPGVDESQPLQPLPQAPGGSSPLHLAPSLPLQPEGQPSATIVSEAASILDEEMARGVLAARETKAVASPTSADQPVLRQVHELIDNIARMWPSGLRAAGSSPASPAALPQVDAHESVPTLKPPSAIRPGRPGSLSMTLCNNEDRPVLLTPRATDFISDRGDRMASAVLQFQPAEIRLEPGEQQQLTGQIAVPVDTRPGCYTGLVVVSGVDYLRALVAIEVQ
jgi:hypothetical protein